ncbi:P-loop NTPase fold protein (plasmid) [Priestia megaterium]|uniref:P-loop NTPase fold protein n=1 Tax=Priestia megaterium TaxID=1404 RepID=UPI00351E8D35
MNNIKRDWNIKRISVINFSFHTLLTILLGFTVRILNNKTVLNLLSEYWKVAILLFLLMTIIFIKEGLTYSKTLDQVIQSYCRPIYLLLLTLLFTVVSISLNITWNLITILIMFFIWGISNYEKEEENIEISNSNKKISTSQISDVPVKSFDYLFPTRKKEFTRIYNYLQSIDTVDPYAIAISATWGEGKTSFINALQEEFKKTNNEIIYIQPMILDTREKLLNYVFSQLETILINHKIYTGKGSPYKKYFELLIKFVNYKSIGNLSSFFDIFPDDKKEDLRELKQDLEKNIEKLALENKKIYIIVDDLDRVENETIYNILTFIKEIVDLKRITVLFLVDYKNIISEKITLEYLEKFINQKFELIKIDETELFDYYLNDIIPDYKTQIINEEVRNLRESFQEYLNIIYNYIQQQIENKQSQVNEGESDKDNTNQEIKHLNKQLNEFKDKISNARYVKKISSSIKETFDYLEKNIMKEKTNITVESKEIKINELIFKLNIFKNLFKEHYDELIRLGNIKNFLSDTSDEFVVAFFSENEKSRVLENNQLLADMKYDFYNSIFFSEDIPNDLFKKIRSETEKLLERIDSEAIYQELCDFEELKNYLKAINYTHEEIDRDLLKERIKKFTYLVITSFKNNNLELHQIFELLGKANRNVLVHSLYFYEKINKFLDETEINSISKKSQLRSQEFLKEVEYALIFNSKQSIIMSLRIYYLLDDNKSFSAIKNPFDKVLNLKQLNETLAGILSLKNLHHDINSVEYFEELFNSMYRRILLNIQEDKLALRGYSYFNKDIETFIKIFKLKALISKKINGLSLDRNSIFEINPNVSTAGEILNQLGNLHNYIVRDKGEPNYQIFRFFHALLNNIDWLINEKRDNLDINYIMNLREIFTYLDGYFQSNESIYNNSSWHYCMIKLTELKKETWETLS